MKILVISDIHDHIENLQHIFELTKNKVQAMICCGDICSPFTAAEFRNLVVPGYVCLGNNDEDHIGLLKQAGDQITWFNLSQEYGVVELDGKKIAFCHYPRLGELLANSGEYSAVFHGHTHEQRNEIVQSTILVNPGAVCGIVKGQSGMASYALYDTQSNTADILNLA